ncbi:MAG: hypothetical protein IH984_15770 [Planctomycetes bacterium]|nr:hypothetical protein [Planctomycetota bacterium]
MKRRLFKLVLFLLLGAIVNVAVAWGCAMWSPTTHEARVADSPFLRDLVGFGYTLRRVVIQHQDYEIIGETADGRLIVEGNSSPLRTMFISDTIRAGWPMRSCLGNAKGSNETRRWTTRIIYPSLILPERWRLLSARPRLPRQPIWPGFAINTIFYATILWLLTLGPFTARRIIRRKRNHCIKCGYDLRGNSGGEVCPECGNETSQPPI